MEGSLGTPTLSTWLDRTGACAAGAHLERSQDRGATGSGASQSRRVWRARLAGRSTGGNPDTPTSPAFVLRTFSTESASRRWSSSDERAQRWLDGMPLRDTLASLGSAVPGAEAGVLGRADAVRKRPKSVHRTAIQRASDISTHADSCPRNTAESIGWPEDLIRARWPELLDLPFNEPIGWPRWLWKARKVASAAVPPRLRPPLRRRNGTCATSLAPGDEDPASQDTVIRSCVILSDFVGHSLPKCAIDCRSRRSSMLANSDCRPPWPVRPSLQRL